MKQYTLQSHRDLFTGLYKDIFSHNITWILFGIVGLVAIVLHPMTAYMVQTPGWNGVLMSSIFEFIFQILAAAYAYTYYQKSLGNTVSYRSIAMSVLQPRILILLAGWALAHLVVGFIPILRTFVYVAGLVHVAMAINSPSLSISDALQRVWKFVKETRDVIFQGIIYVGVVNFLLGIFLLSLVVLLASFFTKGSVSIEELKTATSPEKMQLLLQEYKLAILALGVLVSWLSLLWSLGIGVFTGKLYADYQKNGNSDREKISQ